jgi:hypothetical protein
MRNVLGAVVCLLAPTAFAERICVTPFKGTGAEQVRSAFTDALCVTNACVDPKKVTKGGKPDFAKGKKEKVDYFVTGNIKSKGGKHTLELTVTNKPGAAKLKKTFTYSGTGIPDKTLEQALQVLSKAMGIEEAPQESAAPEKEEPKKEEPRKEEAKEEPPPEKVEKPERKKQTEPPPPPAEDDRVNARQEKEKEEEDLRPRKPVKPPFLSVEAGVELFNRTFSYNAPETNNLRSYSAALIIAPTVRAEFYPIALLSKGFMAGLGVDGTFGIAVGLKSRRSGTDVTWPTNMQHFDFSLRYRIRPIDSIDAAIIPFAGYSMRTFSIGVGTDGSTLDGLPNVAYSAIRPGIAGELPFSDSGFMIFAKFAVQVVLSSGQIISAADTGFFHKGSNFGIEGQLGAGYRVFGPIFVRLAFDFTRYGLGFQFQPTDTYRAGGAVDTYLGGNLAVRLTF